MNRKNPTRPLRAGFEYQDIWGLYLCAQWLCNPKKFKWIKFETIPYEVLDSRFYLDDIILCSQDDLYHLYQVKHTEVSARDYWTWKTLLRQDVGSSGKLKDSLIQKWFKSWFKEGLNGKIEYAALVTNGLASEELQSFIIGERIDINRVRAERNDIYSQISAQLNDEDKLQNFFANFRFLFGQKDIDELENEARMVFYQNLKATKNGVNNLLLRIYKECREQYPSEWTLERITQWCEFDIPRHLNESFATPEDFELFNESLHGKILADLQNKEGGIKVIYGKPGSGKSTYISKLHQILTQKEKIVSIRHHYHISPDDPNPQERLRSSRVVEAIKAQFKEYSEELEDLAYQNSVGVSLQKFISKLAEYFYAQDRAFVLIIDGLDHVLRYSEKHELRNLINEMCFPQPGLWIVFGTQEIAKEHLPRIVFDKCPEKDWIEIGGLGKEAVSNIVKKNLIKLNLPQEKERLNELNEKIFQITQGNPLHLRYTLNRLKTNLDNKLITTFDCANLIPYGDDITQYYSSLWSQLSEHGKTITITISCVSFRFKEEQLFDLLGSIGIDPSNISGGYKSIVHLLSHDRRGIYVYHNSFEFFVLDKPEFCQQHKTIKTAMKVWLEKSNYEELKWAEFKKLTYDLGDPQPILEIERNWLVEAISFPRDPRHVIAQLDLGARAAFENNKYGKVFELASLRQYYHNAVEYVEEEYEKVWEEAFKASNRNISDIDLNELSSRQICIVAQKAEKLGFFDIIDESIEILRDRHRDLEVGKKGEIGSRIPQLPSTLVRIVALDRKHQVKRIHRYVKQFRKLGWAEDLFIQYVDTLLKTEQFRKIHDLLSLDLISGEKQSVLIECAKYDLESKEQHFLDVINSENKDSLSYSCLLYLILKDKPINYVPSLPEYDLFPRSVPEHETGKREERAKLFSKNFILGLIYGLVGKDSELQGWIDGIENRWALQMMSEIFRSSLDLAKQLKEHKAISFNKVFVNISRITPLKWLDQRDLYELQICLRFSLSSILTVIYSLKRNIEHTINLETEEVNQIISSGYFDRENLLQFLLGLDEPLLTQETYKHYVAEEKTRWIKFVTHFSERAEHYADLTRLASIHKDDMNRDSFLELAASNLLGYGYHKDMYLDGLLQSIEICGKMGSQKVVDWIRRIVPIVENVTEYTDGDETHYFPRSLAEILAKLDPSMLYKYYYQKARDEELFLAQDVFKYVLRCLDFKNREDIALATTALDKESFEELKSISGNNAGGKEALEIIEDYLGHIEYPKEETSTYDSHLEKEKIDYSKVKPHQLEKHLESFDTRWSERDFLVPWARHWLSQEQIGKEAICQVLTKIAERDGLYNAESDLLDFLYPLAYEFDNKKAFEHLCWAQANDNGWERYWTHKYKAEQRWDFIKKYYPERHMEFFEKSILYSGTWAGRGGKYSIPIPRGIEFLALFSRLKEIEEITESSIRFAESLMADLELPICRWIDMCDVDELDILLQRLVWPSPIVRERAATGVASLISSSQNREGVFERLLSWISNQRLESIVATGLLPLLKAAEKRDGTVDYLDTDRVAKAVPITSVVIERLLEGLARLLEKPIDFVDRSATIDIVSESYTPKAFFNKYIKSFLAPIYLQRAETIERNTLRGFVRQWAYTSDEIIKDIGLIENREVLDFMGSVRSTTMPGMSTILSEVYRSAFLRTLQYFHDCSLVPDEYYLEYAYATLPVELSYWKVKPSRMPKWWPKMQNTGRNDEEASLYTVNVETEINRIVNLQGDFTILGLDGIVKPKEGWANEVLDTRVILVAFGYKIVGPNIPEASTVASEILYSPYVKITPTSISPFSFLESSSDHIIVGDFPVQVADMIVHPLVVRNHDLVIALWQWFRDYCTPFGLWYGLADKLNIQIAGDSWSYVENGSTVAISSNWLEGLKERHDKDMGIASGSYIEADPIFVKSYLNGHGLRLGYVLKSTHRYREYSYQEAKSFDQYRLIGVSRIITL